MFLYTSMIKLRYCNTNNIFDNLNYRPKKDAKNLN